MACGVVRADPRFMVEDCPNCMNLENGQIVRLDEYGKCSKCGRELQRVINKMDKLTKSRRMMEARIAIQQTIFSATQLTDMLVTEIPDFVRSIAQDIENAVKLQMGEK